MSKISFDFKKIKVKLTNGANLEEIGNLLQNFTSDYLYIEDKKIKGIKNFTDIAYNKCKLIQIDNGYLLKEENTERKIRVFSDKLMKFLTNLEEIDFSELNKKEKICFSINIKTGENNEYMHKNKLKFLDEKNDIDIEKTIILSFTSFLQHKNYKVENVYLEFFDNLFGEVVIITEKSLTNEIIEEIEKVGEFKLEDNEIYFTRKIE